MKKEGVLSSLATVVLVICAVLITALVVRRELSSPAGFDSRTREIENWRSYASGTRSSGARGGPVTIVEFSDFECPFCRLLVARLDSLKALHPGEVSVQYRHFPLPNHLHAVAAARASDCADAQGRFWPMHDALFEQQEQIGQKPWTHFAAAAGVPDTVAFRHCVERGGEDPYLRDDTAAAKRLGVRVTPTLLINQYRLIGVPPLDTLRAYVARARARSD